MKNADRIKIINGKLLTPSGIKQGTILIEAGRIAAVSEGNPDFPDAIQIDASYLYVCAGFIDIHVHGGGGFDFMDGTEEAFIKVAELHAQYGTTSMLPTTLTSEKNDIINTLRVYERAIEMNKSGAAFLGIHLEGPYFAMNQRGAQDPRFIRNPDPAEYREIIASSSHIRRWSAAPELPGALEFAHYLRTKGILVSLAHTDAYYDETVTAFKNGYSLVTHFYSCMNGVTRKNAYRFAGSIEATYMLEELDVEIIADGVHLPAPLLKMIVKMKGIEHTALITDAMRAAGMPPGESILGSKENGLKVIVEDGVAKLPDRSSFAGSVATADRLVRTMVQQAEVSIQDAVRMITEVPARILGLSSSKGALREGMDADIVIFDSDINIHHTMVGGRTVYQKSQI